MYTICADCPLAETMKHQPKLLYPRDPSVPTHPLALHNPQKPKLKPLPIQSPPLLTPYPSRQEMSLVRLAYQDSIDSQPHKAPAL